MVEARQKFERRDREQRACEIIASLSVHGKKRVSGRDIYRMVVGDEAAHDVDLERFADMIAESRERVKAQQESAGVDLG